MKNIKPLSVFLLLWTVFSGVAFSVEFGDATKFALRFDDKTGNLSEIVYKGEVATVPGADEQRFDIQQDKNWAFGLAKQKLELAGIEKKSDSQIEVKQKIGDWTAKFLYSTDFNKATIRRSVELTYTGKEPTKIKSFWMSYPLFPFADDDAEFLLPGQYPPKMFTPKNFNVGAKQWNGRSGCPLVFQLDPKKSVLLFSNQLVDYADRPGGDVSRNEKGLRLVQSFDTKRHVKPGDSFKIGDAYLRFVDGDAETALVKLHDLMRDIGHVVPADRPQWFKEAIAYSMHPGGTTGSTCRDLGGFLPTLDMLPRIKEIGCNVIWFMPLEDKSIYWPRDYYKLQAGLGSTDEKAPEEYKAVVAKAHELGMRVVQDSVPHGGSNTNDRAKEHPYWLAQNEDGSTLDYWCFDFNWPSWIDYMAEVSRFYTKTYGIDGFRIDACGGSKIPNWNPEIPYDRASHSQSQGGLNMVKAIRKALRDEKPDGATLAEVNGSLFGAVSDAVYDFDLCYNILHDVRKQRPEEFVRRLRRWLHEQQYSEIPDLLRLRHVESHDSLRAQLWYGTRTHRNLVALTAYIHGIPLVYHDEEIGHGPQFKGIFETRKALPELNGGTADYLCVDTPPGVFGCLRTGEDGASIVLIDFTDNENAEGTVSLPWSSLPEELRNQDVVYVQLAKVNERIRKIEKQGDCLQLPREGRHGLDAVYVLRKDEKTFGKNEKDGLWNKLQSAGSFMSAVKDDAPKKANANRFANYLKLDVSPSEVLFVDPKTGLLAGYSLNGFVVLGEMDLLLPAELKDRAEKPVIEKTETKISVKRKFDTAMLEIEYFVDRNKLNIESRWTGKNIPKNAALFQPVLRQSLWGSEEFCYQHLPFRRVPEGFYGSIYWRPQGTDLFYDSILNPLRDGRFDGKSSLLFSSYGDEEIFRIGFGDKMPIRFRQQGPMGENGDINLIFSWTDEEVPQLNEQATFSLQIGRVLDFVTPEEPRRFKEVAGGWIFENDYYKLRLARNGQIMTLDSKEKDGSLKSLVSQADIYTDYGYSSKKVRYAASYDVETGIRIVQDDDGTLRIRFEGQLRGFYRFDLMKPPIEFFTEYALNDGPALGFSCGVKTNRLPTDSKGFLALMLPMPMVDAFEYFKEKQSIAKGNSADAKGRSVECKDDFPDRAVLKGNDKALLEFRDIKSEASNLFLDRKNFFVCFDDRDLIGKPNRWRSFSATVRLAANPNKIDAPGLSGNALGPLDNPLIETANNLMIDGGFESQSGDNDLVALQSGAVLKGLQQSASSWNIPQGGSYSTSVFHEGRTSAQVDGEAEQYRLFNQAVSIQGIKPGTKLQLTAQVKGKDLKTGPQGWQIACIRFAVSAEGQRDLRYVSSPALSGTFDWKPVSVEFVVPEKLTGLVIQAGNNGGTGTIWIDDVRLEIIPSEGNGAR